MKRVCQCDKTGIGRPFKQKEDCHPCWLWHHHLNYRVNHGGDTNVTLIAEQPELRNNIPPHVELPTLVTQAVNFGKAIVKHAFSGFKMVDEDTKRARLRICQGCEFFNKTTSRCHKCGCLMNVKSAWAEQKCPIDKW